ncbi:TPA: glycosyltransferase [Candidatus Woesearchaeota archaeon]|nr:glycosyltransferase [Candidatus Woesearchaeota archaeon]
MRQVDKLVDFIRRSIGYSVRHLSSDREELEVSMIVPAFNEEKTIRKVLMCGKRVAEVHEIIIIDDGSSDHTADVVRRVKGVRLIQHYKNRGKGEAIKTGIAHARHDILLFIDADLKNITPEKIKKLITPILKGKADIVKASFHRARGRVTEIAAKPLLRILFPGLSFSQPLSGQFAARRAFLEGIRIEPRWGIEIAMLLDAVEQKQRVVEVDIGELVHKKNPLECMREMSQQVMETMMKKAGILCKKHRIVVFSDDVLNCDEHKIRRCDQILALLRSRGCCSVLITMRDKGLVEALGLKVDHTIFLPKSADEKEVTASIRSVCKRLECRPEQVLLVANNRLFSDAAKRFYSLALTTSDDLLKRYAADILQHPSEVVVLAE